MNRNGVIGGAVPEMTTGHYLVDALDVAHIITARGPACGLSVGAGWQPLDVADVERICPRCLAADRAYKALRSVPTDQELVAGLSPLANEVLASVWDNERDARYDRMAAD